MRRRHAPVNRVTEKLCEALVNDFENAVGRSLLALSKEFQPFGFTESEATDFVVDLAADVLEKIAREVILPNMLSKAQQEEKARNAPAPE